MVDIRLVHLDGEVAGVGRQRLAVAAVALSVNRVEGERRLPRTRQPGEDDELVTGDGQVDVLQIVLAGALDHDLRVLPDGLVLPLIYFPPPLWGRVRVGGSTNVTHGRGPSSGWSLACATSPTPRRPPAAGCLRTPWRPDAGPPAVLAVPPPSRTAVRWPLSSLSCP